jgi:serine/threonine protein kinase/Flp pilus assembly protein TadD
MGEVYKAQDTRLNRAVALKVLPADFIADEDRLRRFVKEAQSASALNHPHILTVYEIGEAPHESQPEATIHYIAMEFIDGDTLTARIHRDKADLKELIHYLAQAAEGLSKAHSAGIIHRDLKPDNIMISRDGYAKILDFGLAKTVETPASKIDDEASAAPTAMMSCQTQPGMVMGTIGYMSPEQAMGKAVDHRSDIFSFGCILYEATTLRQPFKGDSTIDTLHKIIYSQAPAITDFNPIASPDLQRIVHRCLAKDPQQRYQSIRDVAAELKDILRKMESGPTQTPSRIEEAQTAIFDARPTSVSSASISLPVIAIAAFIVAVIAAVSAYFYFFGSGKDQSIDSLAVLPFANADSDPDAEYLSDGITDSLIYSLSRLPELKVKSHASVFRYKGKEADPQQAAQELGVRAVLTGRVVQRGDSLSINADLIDASDGSLLWGQQYNRKFADIISVQEEIAREISEKLRLSGEDRRRMTRRQTESAEAYQLYLRGQFFLNKFTEEGLRTSIDYYQQAIEEDPGYAAAYYGLGAAWSILGNLDAMPPAEAYPKAKAAVEKALQIDEALSEAHTQLGWIHLLYDRDWPGAEREFRRGVESNPNNPAAHQGYAHYFAAMGRSEEARAEMRRAQELDPLSLIISADAGKILYHSRQYDEAVVELRRTLEMDPGFPVARLMIGYVYAQKGMHREAFAAFQKTPDTAQSLLESGSPQVMGWLGYIYATMGRKDEAQKVIERIESLKGRGYISPYDIAVIYAGLGQKDQAFIWLEKGFADRYWMVSLIKVDPKLDALRSDARFQDLLNRAGLAP